MGNGEISSYLHNYNELIPSIAGITYVIDRDYKIVQYSRKKWDAFAEKNNGKDLTEPNGLIGTSVIDFFAGNRVREHYMNLYNLIFDGKRTEIRITAKCDAPEALRDNVIFLTPLYKDPTTREHVIGILHQSLILKVSSRPTVEMLRKDHQERLLNQAKFLEVCSICQFVKFESGGKQEWISSEIYYQLGGTDEMALEHSICDDCSNMINEFM